MKIIVGKSGSELETAVEHNIATLIMAKATSNSLADSNSLPISANHLADLLSDRIANHGFDSVIGPNCYINIYEKFGLFNHAIFISESIVLDTRSDTYIGGDPESSMYYKVGSNTIMLELSGKYDTQTLFAELQHLNPQPPIPYQYGSESVVLHRALRLPRGYGGLRLHKDDARSIIDALFKAGIRGILRTEELHVTLMYDTSNPVLDNDQPDMDMVYKAGIKGIDRYGQKGSRWEAIVLKLDSPDALARHKYLIGKGYRHSYPEFKPHLSLKYQPDEGDMEKIKELYDTGAFPSTVRLHDEYWEECDGD